MRPSLDEYLMGLAQLAATRTTCIRRGVGCVLADNEGHVLSIGYNGVARGQAHCNMEIHPLTQRSTWCGECEGDGSLVIETNARFPQRMTCPRCNGSGWYYVQPLTATPHACIGHLLPPGQDQCEAVHAEQNALLQCADPRRIHTAYVTLSPCKNCIKLLLNTQCKNVVFLEEHTDLTAKSIWEKLGRNWHQHIKE